MTAPATIGHFERLAPSYARLRRRWPLALVQDREEQAVHDLAPVPPGARVLDAGCGVGHTMTWLRSRGVIPIGVDRARAMAAECQRRSFAVSVQDMEALAFRPVFDWVLCVGSLEFTTAPLAALRSFVSCLQPDGELVLLCPRRNWLGVLYAMYHRAHGTPIHLFSRAQIDRLLRDAGFEAWQWRRAAMAFICRARRRR